MMDLSDDKKKVISLLEETILLLCKNGLAYSSELSIDGLIVITLDKQETFHACIKSNAQKILNKKCNDKDAGVKKTTADHVHSSENNGKNKKSPRKNAAVAKNDDNSENSSSEEEDLTIGKHSLRKRKGSTAENNNATEKKRKTDDPSSKKSLNSSVAKQKGDDHSPKNYCDTNAGKTKSPKQGDDSNSNSAKTSDKRKPKGLTSKKANENDISKESTKEITEIGTQIEPIVIDIKEEKLDEYFENNKTLAKCIGTISAAVTEPSKHPLSEKSSSSSKRKSTTESTGPVLLASTLKNGVFNLTNSKQVNEKDKYSAKQSEAVNGERLRPTPEHPGGNDTAKQNTGNSSPGTSSGYKQAAVIDIRPQNDDEGGLPAIKNEPITPSSVKISLPSATNLTQKDVESVMKKFDYVQAPPGLTVYTLAGESCKNARTRPPRESLPPLDKVGVFKCNFCNSKFLRESNFKKHLKEHKNL